MILSYQNRKRNIIVPRSIPLVSIVPPKIKPTPPPTPIKPKKPEVISEEDELMIPVQDRNPGVIKKDDEVAIRKIANSDKIPCADKTPKNPIPVIPKLGYIDYPKYNNFTVIKD